MSETPTFCCFVGLILQRFLNIKGGHFFISAGGVIKNLHMWELIWKSNNKIPAFHDNEERQPAVAHGTTRNLEYLMWLGPLASRWGPDYLARAQDKLCLPSASITLLPGSGNIFSHLMWN